MKPNRHDLRHLLRVLRWVLRDWWERGAGWNWSPGLYRCDEGWHSGGVNYGCREPGTTLVRGRWLCRYHHLLDDAAQVATPSW